MQRNRSSYEHTKSTHQEHQSFTSAAFPSYSLSPTTESIPLPASQHDFEIISSDVNPDYTGVVHKTQESNRFIDDDRNLWLQIQEKQRQKDRIHRLVENWLVEREEEAIEFERELQTACQTGIICLASSIFVKHFSHYTPHVSIPAALKRLVEDTTHPAYTSVYSFVAPLTHLSHVEVEEGLEGRLFAPVDPSVINQVKAIQANIDRLRKRLAECYVQLDMIVPETDIPIESIPHLHPLVDKINSIGKNPNSTLPITVDGAPEGSEPIDTNDPATNVGGTTVGGGSVSVLGDLEQHTGNIMYLANKLADLLIHESHTVAGVLSAELECMVKTLTLLSHISPLVRYFEFSGVNEGQPGVSRSLYTEIQSMSEETKEKTGNKLDSLVELLGSDTPSLALYLHHIVPPRDSGPDTVPSFNIWSLVFECARLAADVFLDRVRRTDSSSSKADISGVEEYLRVKDIVAAFQFATQNSYGAELASHLTQSPPSLPPPSPLFETDKLTIETRVRTILTKMSANLLSIKKTINSMLMLWSEILTTGIQQRGANKPIVKGEFALMYAMYYISVKLTETTVDDPPEIFRNIYFAGYLSQIHPLLHDFLMFQLYSHSKFTIPFVPSKNTHTPVQYKMLIGYRVVDKKLESTEFFLNKEKATISFFCGYLQFKMDSNVQADLLQMRVQHNIPLLYNLLARVYPLMKAHDPASPFSYPNSFSLFDRQLIDPNCRFPITQDNKLSDHRLNLLWTWIALLCNMKDLHLCFAMSLDIFVRFSGSNFLQHFNRQAQKLLRVIKHQILPVLKTSPRNDIGNEVGVGALSNLTSCLNTEPFVLHHHEYSQLAMQQSSSTEMEHITEHDRKLA